jgi:hypothetical protein
MHFIAVNFGNLVFEETAMILLLRGLVLLLLILALINPSMPFGQAATDVFVVLDDSMSMEGKLSQATWSAICKQLQNLPKGSQVSLIRYGKEPVIEIPLTDMEQPIIKNLLGLQQPPSGMPIERTGSNLENALLLTAQQIRSTRPSTLLIINDNQQTAGNALSISKILQQQGHKLFQLNLSNQNSATDVWIQNINAPNYAEAAQTLPISVTLGSNTLKAANLNIAMNGAVKFQTPVQLTEQGVITLPFTIKNCQSDSCLITAELTTEDADAVPMNNTFSHAITTQVSKPVLYLYQHQSHPALLASLLSGKYPLKALDAGACVSAILELAKYKSIILDNLAIADMPVACWQDIKTAVRTQGVGLIVLGGDNSFAAGAYRHSLLEEILPVTAEAAKQYPASALLFLVDKSGSMDSNHTESNRIDMAKQAILKTLESQNQLDSFGLISFDSQANLAIPIQHYENPAETLNQHFASLATGGTRLKPALDLGIKQFETISAQKQFLVLVTDGFLDEQDLKAVEQQLATQKIEVIILAIGDDARTNNLQRLAAASHGKLLRVNNSAELPLLMRKELDERRLPAETGKIKVTQNKPLPFLKADTKWPELSGYNVARAKLNSTVYLSAAQGDPLLITGNEGLGKVIALPSGLGSWTQDWLKWQQWSKFITGLIDWSAITNKHSQLDWTLSSSGKLQIDAITSDGEWANTMSGTLTLNNPDDQVDNQRLTLIAPGRYLGELSLQDKGLYHISARITDTEAAFYFFNNVTEEFLPNPPTLPLSAIPFNINNNQQLTEKHSVKLRSALIASALMLYLFQTYLTLFSHTHKRIKTP